MSGPCRWRGSTREVTALQIARKMCEERCFSSVLGEKDFTDRKAEECGPKGKSGAKA